MNRREFLATTTVAAPFIAGCADGGGTPTATPTETPTETSGAFVAATNMDDFDPKRVSIEPGETVTWKNTASGAYSSHTVTNAQFHDKAAEWSMDESFSGGGRLTHTFETAGVYEYYCTVHGESSMCGVVLVGDVSLDQSLPCD